VLRARVELLEAACRGRSDAKPDAGDETSEQEYSDRGGERRHHRRHAASPLIDAAMNASGSSTSRRSRHRSNTVGDEASEKK
jgi:hypothetical protein